MESTEDVPPLEDMSELINQVDALRELKKQQGNTSGNHLGLQNGHSNKQKSTEKQPKEATSSKPECAIPVTKTEVKENVQDKSKTQASVPQKKSDFGGMKKGFLFGGSSSKPKQSSSGATKTDQSKSSAPKKTLEDIPFIQKNDEAKTEKLKFSEVQEAMANTTSKLMENKEWVTDDLLSNLEKNEKLTRRLQDPTFIQAIGEFQKNPQAAMMKYGNNKEVQEFFQDFCGLMGNHFSKLSDQQPPAEPTGGASGGAPSSSPSIATSTLEGVADLQVRSSTNPNQPTARDETKMKQILSDPEIRVILMDPKIQDLFEHLRNDPVKGQKLLEEAGPELKQKIQKLCSVGLLQFQTG